MVEKIFDFFSTRLKTPDNSPEVQNENRLALATCALLLEMAHTDTEFSSEEQEAILKIMQKYFEISAEDAGTIIELAGQEREESLDLWQFTNLINLHFNRAEKLRVLEILWAVIYADGRVDMHEEYLMRKLSNLLNMDHSDMIQTKIKAREFKLE